MRYLKLQKQPGRTVDSLPSDTPDLEDEVKRQVDTRITYAARTSGVNPADIYILQVGLRKP
jgi:hypothetical protein